MAETGKFFYIITAAEGKDIKDVDFIGKSDPYLKLKLGKITVKTATKKDTLCPVWNEKFTFSADDGDELEVELWDDNDIKKDELLGNAKVKLEKQTCATWVDIVDARNNNKKNGKIKLSIKYGAPGSEEEEKDEGNVEVAKIYAKKRYEDAKKLVKKYHETTEHHHKCCHAMGLLFLLYVWVIVMSVYTQTRPPVGVEPQVIKRRAKANEDADNDSFFIKNDYKFEPYALEYSPHNALQLARMSSLVYNDRANITATLKRWGFTRSQFFAQNDTEALLAQSEHTIVMAWRGTSSVEDALTDLDVLQDPTPHGKAHSGFLEAISFVWDDIYATLDAWVANDRGSAIFVTGHSLGAALATLATARLRLDHDMPVHGLYTYGSPRAVNKAYASKFNKDFGAQTFRHVHMSDIVARVPLAFLWDYRHVGRLFYLDQGVLRQSISFWAMLVDAFQESIKDILALFKLDFTPDSLEDHFTLGYINELSALLPDYQIVQGCEVGVKGACKPAWL